MTLSLIMVAAYPIMTEKGEFVGIAGGAIKISSMIRFISSIKLGKTGYPSLVDSEGRVILHPDKSYILTENLKGEFITLNSLDGVPDDDIWSKMFDKKSWYGRTRIINRPEEEDIILETLLAPLLDQSDQIYGYLEIGRDITHEMKIEERFNQLQKMESIGTLAGGIAHDFNNILSIVFGYAQMTLEDLEDPESIEKNIKQILSAAKRAKKLVNQILRNGYKISWA